MQCSSPINLTAPEGSVMTVGCGRCMPCRVNRTQEWGIRIMHEAKLHKNSLFVTLTYCKETLPKNGTLVKRDLQLFFKKLRNFLKVRYYACGEYGDKMDRPHYHIALFGASIGNRDFIEKCWSKGFIHIGTLTTESANYCAKYLQKQLYGAMSTIYIEKGIQKEFLLTSRKPGIGKLFAEPYLDNWAEKGYLINDGVKKPIPRYYLSLLSEKKYKKYQYESEIRRLQFKVSTGLTEYEISDKEVAERKQREKNVIARMDMKKNKL